MSAQAARALEAHGAEYDALLREPALTRYLVVTRHQQDIPDATELQQSFVDELRRDPERGLHWVREGLAKLPLQGYPLERTALLAAGLALTGKEQEVQKLAYEELTTNPAPRRPDPATARTEDERNQALSTTWDMVRTVGAYQVMLRTAPPNEIFESTLTTIAAQPDSMVRERMAAQFFERYPAQGEDLRERLAQQKIPLPSGS